MTKIKKKDVDSTALAISETLERKAIVTPMDVRLALMDYPDKNIPLYMEHLTDEMLWKCLDWALAYFNETPPDVGQVYTLANFPKRKLLLDGAVVEALKLTALVELRGEMSYSDGGVQSTVYYKSPQFIALRQEAQQRFEAAVQSSKRALNINNCYGALC